MRVPSSLHRVALLLLLLTGSGCGVTHVTGDEAEPVAPRSGSRALQSLICRTVQRGGEGGVADAVLNSNEPEKASDDAALALVGTAGPVQRHLLLRFELEGIPSHATVHSATLTLWSQASTGGSLDAHAITGAWQEDSVTWNSFAGAFASPTVGTLVASQRGLHSLDLTELVLAWVRTPALNHGLLLEQDEGQSLLATSESVEPSRRPRLEVCYSLPESVPEGTSLLLQVLDVEGHPISTAPVVQGEALWPTDGVGRLLFQGLSPGRFTAHVDVPGYAPAAVSLELREGLKTGAQVRVLPVAATTTFPAEVGTSLVHQGVRVSIPPAAVVDVDDLPVSGPVILSLTPLDPTTHIQALPGPLEGIATADGGERVALESFFMAEVNLRREDGEPLQLAPGARATLEFPVPDALAARVRPGDTLPAWWLDLDRGVWVREGEGEVRDAGGGHLVWVAQVGHFTWWNADVPISEMSCVNLGVVDASSLAIQDVPVVAIGRDYAGSHSSYTGSNGYACVQVKLGGTADVYVGVPGSPLENQVRTVTGTVPGACGGSTCLRRTITLLRRITRCTPGASNPCRYGGPAGTEDAGVCQAGADTCDTLGLGWSGCVGEVLPRYVDDAGTPVPDGGTPRDHCDTPFDDDCDGLVNEVADGCRGGCTLGTPPAKCYTGRAELAGVGICNWGERKCISRQWGSCQGSGFPETETCDEPTDEDCNGSTECNDLHLWSMRFGDTACQQGNGVAADADGGVAMVGTFSGTLDLGGGTAVSSSATAGFVTMRNADGTPRWSHALVGTPFAYAQGVAVDGAGNVVVAGYFTGELRLDTTPLPGMTSAGSHDIFVVKLGPGGNLLWSQRFGSTNTDKAFHVEVDAVGNVLLAGEFWGSLPVVGSPHSPHTSVGWTDAFVIKLDRDGNPLWSRSWGGTMLDRATSVAVGGDDSVVVTGVYTRPVNLNALGGPVLTNAGASDFFVVKLGSGGNHLWSKGFGGSGDDIAWDVEADGAGNVLVTGSFMGTVDFRGPPPSLVTSTGDRDGFLLKLVSTTGATQWIRRFGGPTADTGYALAVDPTGNVFLTGSLIGPVNFTNEPPDVRTAHGGYDSFVARFDADGSHRWSQVHGDTTNQSAYGIALDGVGNVLLTGGMEGQVLLGDPLSAEPTRRATTLESQGCTDVFLAKLRATP